MTVPERERCGGDSLTGRTVDAAAAAAEAAAAEGGDEAALLMQSNMSSRLRVLPWLVLGLANRKRSVAATKPCAEEETGEAVPLESRERSSCWWLWGYCCAKRCGCCWYNGCVDRGGDGGSGGGRLVRGKVPVAVPRCGEPVAMKGPGLWL